MLAVVKTGGKQYLVKEGDKVKIEKLDQKEGEKVSLETLATFEENGSKLSLGKGKVEAKILAQKRARKIEVIKFKSKTRYRRKRGHRQLYTQVEITKIS